MEDSCPTHAAALATGWGITDNHNDNPISDVSLLETKLQNNIPPQEKY